MREIGLMQRDRVRITTPAEPGRYGPRRGLLRRFGPVVAVAASVLLVSGVVMVQGGWLGLGSEPGGLKIQLISDGVVRVEVSDTRAKARQMTRQLQDQGLNVEVDTMPAGPQVVGKWVSAEFTQDVPESVAQSVIDQMAGYVAAIEIPTSFPGEITLAVGVAPEPGEEVMVDGTVNALAPGGPLGCLKASLGDPEVVAEQVADLGYTVTWANGDNFQTAPVDAPIQGQRVVAAVIKPSTPATVQLVVASPTNSSYESRARLGFAPQQWQGRASIDSRCAPPLR